MEVIFISLIEKNKGERFGWGLEKSEETGFLQIIKIIDDEIADLNGFQIDDVVTKIFDLKQKEYIGLDSTRSDFRKKCDGLTNGLISMRRIVEQNASTEEDSNNEGRQIPQAPQLLPKKQKPVEVLENITRKRPLRTCVKRKLQTKTKPISNKISTSSRSYLKKIRTDSKARKAAASFHEFRKSVTPRVIGSKQSVNHNQINNDIVENSNFAALSPNFLENTLPSTSSCLPDEDTAVVSVHEEASNFSSLTGVMQNSTHNFDFAPISSFFTEPDASKSPDFSSISSTTEPNKPANEDALKFFIVDLNISHEEKREMLSCKRLKIAAKLKKIEAKNRLIQTEIETVIAKKAKYKEDVRKIESSKLLYFEICH